MSATIHLHPAMRPDPEVQRPMDWATRLLLKIEIMKHRDTPAQSEAMQNLKNSIANSLANAVFRMSGDDHLTHQS